jgi:hypothetical protein
MGLLPLACWRERWDESLNSAGFILARLARIAALARFYGEHMTAVVLSVDKAIAYRRMKRFYKGLYLIESVYAEKHRRNFIYPADFHRFRSDAH